VTREVLADTLGLRTIRSVLEERREASSGMVVFCEASVMSGRACVELPGGACISIMKFQLLSEIDNPKSAH
jgi:hypothetical protein